MLFALGLVVVAMRQLDQPETAERLGRLFSTMEESSEPSVDALQIAKGDEDLKFESGASSIANPPAMDNRKLATEANADVWAAVEDNTYFRAAEGEAWFGLWQRLQTTNTAQLEQQSLGTLTYAQLLKQPDYYRGKAVTIRGTIRREELVNAPNNAVGIASYHRLWIEPQGGANWPIVVYCLRLDEQFPRGDQLKVPVTATGYYFKNWSYPYLDGLGIAPVVLSKQIEWTPNLAGTTQRAQTQVSLKQMVVLASVFAILVVLWVVRSTRRSSRRRLSAGANSSDATEHSPATIREQLGKLADAEAQQ